jgi:hypothetical protein
MRESKTGKPNWNGAAHPRLALSNVFMRLQSADEYRVRLGERFIPRFTAITAPHVDVEKRTIIMAAVWT